MKIATHGGSLGDDPRDLLEPDVSQISEWLTALAPRKAFRVRGLSFVTLNVRGAVSELEPFLGLVAAEIAARPGWALVRALTKEELSIRQVYDAFAKKPLQFHKAAAVCVLCELAAATPAAGRAPISAADLFQTLRIEPALWRVSDFGQGQWDRLKNSVPNLPNILRRRCLQDEAKVFADLANGQTVSHRLATRVVRVLREMQAGGQFADELGGVMLSRQGRRVPVSLNETIDGPSVVDPDEVLPA